MLTSNAELIRRFTRSVFSAQSALLKHGDTANARFGQSSARWRGLLQVSIGNTTVAEIARITGYSRQAVQRVTSLLVDEGNLVSTPDSVDGRKLRLSLTPLGRRTLNSMEKYFDTWSARLVKELSSDKLAALASALDVITAAVLADLNKFGKEKQGV